MHTLLFYEPGHFHAALVLRRSNPRVQPDVHVYARPSPDRDAFLALVATFNARDDEPTSWRVHVHDDGDDLLGRLIEEKRGNAVILAGRNDHKIDTIAALHAAGLHVLADKPWALNEAAIAPLTMITAGTPESVLAMDIMTGRHDVIARLRKLLIADPELFGSFRDGPEPTIEIGSIHHLLKTVNGEPLRRPAWYYDVRVQGDGLVDIQSHMTDQAQWLLESDRPYEYTQDVQLHRAQSWRTPVPLDLYQRSTGQSEFHPTLQLNVTGDVLHYGCNGVIDYHLRGVSVRQTAEWRPVEPDGSGDQHHTVIRGTRADVVVRQGLETGFRAELHLRAIDDADAPSIQTLLAIRTQQWRAAFPGLDVHPSDIGSQLDIPPSLHTPHEAHFAMVLESFLDYLDAGTWPKELNAAIRTRYTLLANAHQLARETDHA